MREPIRHVLALLGLWVLLAGASSAEPVEFILLQSTTSTENSGLLDYLLPKFREKTGIEVRVVAVGTGQALRNAERGDGDVVLVHAREAEERFIAKGFGLARHDVMYNDFVVVGPSDDPAGIRGMTDVTEALAKIASAQAVFVSRGDDSGTHKREQSLWRETGLDPSDASGRWYRESGAGQGATLNIAAGMGGYTLTDRGTWISFNNKRDLEILVEGDPRLLNPYGVIAVNPERHSHVKADAAQRFIEWLTGREGQRAIASYRIGGEQLFFPNAEGAIGGGSPGKAQEVSPPARERLDAASSHASPPP